MNFRDVELLSAYLDGQLKPSDSARLESRLSSDPGLGAVLDDLRASRNLLRQLPTRKAPRNFTLTPKMVGIKPPMPRTYPIFRFATALAALLLVFSFAVNGLAPRSTPMMVAAPACQGCGGGGGVPLQAPVATEAPATEAPMIELAVPTETLPATNGARVAETPSPKMLETESVAPGDQLEVRNEAPVPFVLQIGLALAALLCGVSAFIVYKTAMRKWQEKNK